MIFDESRVTVAESVDFVKACIKKRQQVGMIRPRSLTTTITSSPTKELNALVLGDSLIGYGGNISLANMRVVENIILMSKIEAKYQVPDNKDAKGRYIEFVNCMESLGFFVPDSGYSKYRSSSISVTMENVMVDIIKAAVDAAKAAIPGATVLGAIADSTMTALKNEEKAINLLNTESKDAEGVRLTAMPCEQFPNGQIVVALAAVDHRGSSDDGGVLFVDWKTSALDIFQGKAFLTFDPARYAEVKDLVEEYLASHRKTMRSERFSRRA
ncbi:MAG: hypothetical protein JWP42_1870 [Pseudomonas sp.]|nr:hypothetical protein [Pseudomonas sp.]